MQPAGSNAFEKKRSHMLLRICRRARVKHTPARKYAGHEFYPSTGIMHSANILAQIHTGINSDCTNSMVVRFFSGTVDKGVFTVSLYAFSSICVEKEEHHDENYFCRASAQSHEVSAVY